MNHILLLPELIGDKIMTTPALAVYKDSLPDSDKLLLLVEDNKANKLVEGYPQDGILTFHNSERDDIVNAIPKDWDKCSGGKWKKLDCVDAYKFGEKHPTMVKNNQGKIFLNPSHMSYGYAAQLGVRIDSPRYQLTIGGKHYTWARKFLEEREKPTICVAPYSHSCKRFNPDNPLCAYKTINFKLWEELEERFPEYSFLYLGASEKEKVTAPNGEWILGEDLRNIAALIKECSATISVMTGTNHLAQAVDARLVSVCTGEPYGIANTGLNTHYHLIDTSWTNKDDMVTVDMLEDGVRRVLK